MSTYGSFTTSRLVFKSMLICIVDGALRKYDKAKYCAYELTNLFNQLDNAIPEEVVVRWGYLFNWNRLVDLYVRNIRPQSAITDSEIAFGLLSEFIHEVTKQTPHSCSWLFDAFTKPSPKVKKSNRRLFTATPSNMKFIDRLHYENEE